MNNQQNTSRSAQLEDEVKQLLRGVVDPELGADIVTLGMVGAVKLVDDVLNIEVRLTIAGCPLRTQIQREIQTRTSSLPGVGKVRVEWGVLDEEGKASVMERARLIAQQNAKPNRIPGTCRVIAFWSGKGGVGKSALSANVAVALARRGHRVGVLDADIWGFSQTRMLGAAGSLAARADSSGRPLITPLTRCEGSGELVVVSTGSLVDERTALMWRGLMLNKAVEQFLQDVDWGPLDYLVIDAPPGTGDVAMGLARALPQMEVILVTAPSRVSAGVASRAADMARRSHLHVLGVVENMAGVPCGHGSTVSPFGEGGGTWLASEIGVELLASIPLDAAVSAGSDAGVAALDSEGFAGAALRGLVDRLYELVPVINADGCSARMLAAVAAALASTTSSDRPVEDRSGSAVSLPAPTP